MLNELNQEVTDGIEAFMGLARHIKPDVVRQVWTQFCRNPYKVGWKQPWGLFVLVRFLLNHKLEI
jgi:hypothetical protein